MLTDNELIQMLRLSDTETFYVWTRVDHVFLSERTNQGWELDFLYEPETVTEITISICAYRLSEATRAKNTTQ